MWKVPNHKKICFLLVIILALIELLFFENVFIIRRPGLILKEAMYISFVGEEATPLKNQLQRISSQPLHNSPVKRQISHPSPGNPSPETPLQSSKHSTPKTPPDVNRPKSSQKLIKQNNDQHFSISSRERKVSSDVVEHVNSWTEDATKSLLKEMTVGVGDDLYGDYSVDLQDIKELFKPLPAALSPVHSPSTELVS